MKQQDTRRYFPVALSRPIGRMSCSQRQVTDYKEEKIKAGRGRLVPIQDEEFDQEQHRHHFKPWGQPT